MYLFAVCITEDWLGRPFGHVCALLLLLLQHLYHIASHVERALKLWLGKVHRAAANNNAGYSTRIRVQSLTGAFCVAWAS